MCALGASVSVSLAVVVAAGIVGILMSISYLYVISERI